MNDSTTLREKERFKLGPFASENRYMGIRFDKPTLAILVCIACAAGLWADTSTLTELQSALQKNDVELVKNDLAAFTPGTPEMAEAEAAVLKAARAATLDGKFDLALGLAEAVLLADLDNAEAQDLYTSIEEAKQNQLALEAKQRAAAEEAHQQQEAEAKAKAEAEAKRQEAQKAEKERQAKEAFIQSVRVIGLKNFSGTAELSPALFSLYSSPFADAYSGNESPRSLCGFSAGAGARFTHPYVTAAIRAHYEYSPLAFGEADQRQAFWARVSVGTPILGIPLCISGGYQSFSFFGSDGSEADTVMFTSVRGPTIGLGIEEWRVTPAIDLSLDAEWLGAALADSIIDFAFQAELAARYKFPIVKNLFRPFVGADITFVGMLTGGEMESSCGLSVTVGALFNEYQ
jgi:hypothetical protein